MVIAPADYNSITIPLKGNNNKLIAEPFTVPWNWGKNFDLSSVVSYALSTCEGEIAYLN